MLEYKPALDGRITEEQKSLPNLYNSKDSFQLQSESASFNHFDCNMIIWGKWKSVYSEPIQLNIEGGDGGEDALIKQCISQMLSTQEFCLFITEEGRLYAMGQNESGMLGLGKKCKNTFNSAKEIILPKKQKVIDVKAGRNHILALTNDGEVYGWGMNNHGQVGTMIPEGSASKYQVIYEPSLVYPTAEAKDLEIENLFDFAKQIEVYEDSSFLLTEDGHVYSWGKNDNGFLGRESSLEVKMTALTEKQRKLTFSTNTPGRVSKLEKFNVKRIEISEGKFLAYLVERQFYYEDEVEKDSSADSDEEKDYVADINKTGEKAQAPLTSTNKQKKGGPAEKADNFTQAQKHSDSNEALRKQPTENSKHYSRSSSSSKMLNTNNTNSMATGRKGGRQDKDQKKKWQNLIEILKKALAIKDELNKFDRTLADSIRPLTDLNDRNIYYKVIDKFATGEEKVNDAEELRHAIDRMQVQLKKSLAILEKQEQKINENLQDLINARASTNRGDEEVFKDLLILVDLFNESLTLKKFNLVGCKMKVYQERMKEINFLEMISQFKDNDQIDIDKCGGHLHTCKKLCKKIQQSLKKNQDYYLQMHVNCSVPSSLALSALTNSVFTQCDIWDGLNKLSSYTYILQSKIQEAEYTNDKIRNLWQYFQQLQKTDFNKKVEQYQKKQKDYGSTKEWFDAIMRDINFEIKTVITAIRNSMKEDKGENDILYYFQDLIHDNALIRQLQYSAQQALFESAQNQHKQGGTPTAGGPTSGGTKAPQSEQAALNQSQSSSQGGQPTKGSGLFGGMLSGMFTKKGD